jgi:thioredoxin-related protein
MLLYDKNGEEYDVPHVVDQKEWIKTGNFFKEKPKKQTAKTNSAPKHADIKF